MAEEEEKKTLIEILEENNPIDIVKYINFVRAPECGAIATFSGTTRDTFDGKAVVELRYEAYVPMAIRCIKAICTSAREMWSLNLIAVAHCLGPVSASVPIWKKEVYANGEVWKENSEFIERRSELWKEGRVVGSCQRKVKEEVDDHKKKACCGAKVRVDDERENKTNSDNTGIDQ
uniref:Molybdopterin synthase catalytic subunit n=1 Tax=Chenopodium quinoa TaxID=63459 RepID=A0A803L3Y3_CHEQI